MVVKKRGNIFSTLMLYMGDRKGCLLQNKLKLHTEIFLHKWSASLCDSTDHKNNTIKKKNIILPQI